MNNDNEFKPCDETCKLCFGVGLVDCGEAGYALCPNDPRKYRDTGVRESDIGVPERLKQTKTMKVMETALSELLTKGFGLAYLQGDYGIGKTVTAKAWTARAVRKFESGVYYRRQSDLINWLRASYDSEHGQAEYKRRLDKIKYSRWLVIDELGRDRFSDFGRESLNEILDSRYMGSVEERNVTILVSNFAPEKIFEPYIIDRIRDSKNRVLSLASQSLRVNTHV